MSQTRIVLPVEGMHCAGCVGTVQRALAATPGVTSATVNLATAKAAVDFDDAETSAADLVEAVRDAGYQCDTTSVSFAVEDLHYAAGVAGLEQALAALKGVIRASANQATEIVTVDYVPGAVMAGDLERAVVAAGF